MCNEDFALFTESSHMMVSEKSKYETAKKEFHGRCLFFSDSQKGMMDHKFISIWKRIVIYGYLKKPSCFRRNNYGQSIDEGE